MKKPRPSKQRTNRDCVVRRPLFWTVFLAIMCLCSLILCFQDTEQLDPSRFIDEVDLFFYRIVGLSIWVPITVAVFVLWAITLSVYLRFKVVIHERGFTVTPIVGTLHDVPYASVEKVVQVGWSTKGAYIDIFYQGKKLRIPYTRNRHDTFRQKGFALLLRNFRSHGVPIHQHLDMRENWNNKRFD